MMNQNAHSFGVDGQIQKELLACPKAFEAGEHRVALRATDSGLRVLGAEQVVVAILLSSKDVPIGQVEDVRDGVFLLTLLSFRFPVVDLGHENDND